MKSKLSNKGAVALENIDGVDYLYFVDHQTKRTFRLPLSVLAAWLAANGPPGNGGSSAAISDSAESPTSVETAREGDLAAVHTRAAGVYVERTGATSWRRTITTAAGRLVQQVLQDAAAYGSGLVDVVMSPGAPIPVFPTPGAAEDTMLVRAAGDGSGLGGATHGYSIIALAASFSELARLYLGRGVGADGRFGFDLHAGSFGPGGAGVKGDSNGQLTLTGTVGMPTVLAAGVAVPDAADKVLFLTAAGNVARANFAASIPLMTPSPPDPGVEVVADGAGGLQAGAARTLSAVGGFSPTYYLEGGVGEMRGATGGFAVHVACRMRAVPAGWSTLVGNLDPYAPGGGWAIGIEPTGFTFAIAQQSDGLPQLFTPAGPALLSAFRGGRLHRWHMVSLVYTGGTAYLVVDEEVVGSITPSGGYALADAARAPRFGRTESDDDPLVGGDVFVHAVAYTEDVSGGLVAVQQMHAAVARSRIPSVAMSGGGLYVSGVIDGDGNLTDAGGTLSPMVRIGGGGNYGWENLW